MSFSLCVYLDDNFWYVYKILPNLLDKELLLYAFQHGLAFSS